MLASDKIRIHDRHQRCGIELKDNTSFGTGVALWAACEFTRDETVEIERVLHEYNERQKP